MQTRRRHCAQHGDNAVDIPVRLTERACLPAATPSTGCAQEKVRGRTAAAMAGSYPHLRFCIHPPLARPRAACVAAGREARSARAPMRPFDGCPDARLSRIRPCVRQREGSSPGSAGPSRSWLTARWPGGAQPGGRGGVRPGHGVGVRRCRGGGRPGGLAGSPGRDLGHGCRGRSRAGQAPARLPGGTGIGPGGRRGDGTADGGYGMKTGRQPC